MAQNNESTATAAKGGGFIEFLKKLGPSIITVLSWLGAGDIITSAVSGSSYGYALMWVLVLSYLIRFVIVNCMQRFELMNVNGEGMIHTWAKMTKLFPIILCLGSLIIGNMTVGYILLGAAQCLMWLLGFGDQIVYALILAVLMFVLLGGSVFSKLENVFKVLIAAVVLILIVLAVTCTPNPVDIAQGLLFSIPSNDGAYDVMIVILGMVGAVAGSMGNLFQGINLAEGGVRDASAYKGQTKSLLFSVVMGAILILCVWVVGAEILRPNGIEVNTLQDIGLALEMYLGVFGAKLFYLGIGGTLFCAGASCALGYTKLFVANFNELFPNRQSRAEFIQQDKLYTVLLAIMIAVAFLWSLPMMPSQVYMTLLTNALQVFVVPFIAVGVLLVTASKKYMGDHTNNIAENIVLIITTVLAIVSVVQTFL
ncbi:Nramp family divalent metal transporter [Candidatus Collinsella stercoripullorum]|uniref:Nramp family divalent metal transporter n=1 Tax=Candidatus Collinsella stercoripullorum TaxID=2838522 RepID=UPI0022E05C58|nr:Nramp family divalent metal transporter [Candidatus Collinsella stercoripullorum]